MQKILKILAGILIGIFGLLILTIGIFALLNLFDKGKSSDYFPKDHALRIEVESLGKLIDNLTEWEATEIALSSSEMGDIYKSYLEWKNNPLRENPLIKRTLALRADILFNTDFTPLVVVDMGWRSFINRLFLLTKPLLRFSPVEITTQTEDRITIYKIVPPPIEHTEEDQVVQPPQPVYMYIKGKIILIGTDEAYIRETAMGAPHKYDGGLQYAFSEKPLIKMHLNTKNLLKEITPNIPGLAPLQEQLSFDKETLLAATVKPGQIRLEGYTPIDSRSQLLTNYLSYDPGPLKAPRRLPETVNILSGFRFKSLQSLLDLTNSFMPEKNRINLQSLDPLLKTFFGLDSQEFLFDWFGQETGAFTLAGFSSSPVIFMEIGNHDALGNVFETLKGSFLLKAKDNLIVNDTRISSLNIPGPIKQILQLFTGPMETPFLIQYGDYLYMSSNPETLAYLASELRSSKKLASTKSFKSLTGRLPNRSPLLFYYDLNSAMPRFLLHNNTFAELLRLYEKGHFFLNYHQDELRFQFHGERAPLTETAAFPGFPVDTNESINSQVLISNLGDSPLQELIFINKKQELIITDLLGQSLSRTSLPKKSTILKVLPQRGVFTFGKGGFITIPLQGISLDQQAEQIDYDWTFDPVPFKDGYLIYDTGSSQLMSISLSGAKALGGVYNKEVLSAPDVWRDEILGIAPTDIRGNFFLANDRGESLPNWPQKGGGKSFHGPKFIEEGRKIYVAFLAQKGILTLWDRSGTLQWETPLNLEGSFTAPPVGVKNGKDTNIAVLNRNGEISIITLGGEIIQEEKVSIPENENTRLLAYDVNGDGIEEIFLYGAGNKIFGWNSNLGELPGFPVRGHFKPTFLDLDSNGQVEMFTGGLDKKIYSYTIRTEAN